MSLTPAERKTLRARAHALKPVVLVGGKGITPAVLKEIDAALRAHELLKVQVAGEDREGREAAMDVICAGLACEPVQVIGRVLVVYRPLPETGAAPVRPARRRAPRLTKRSQQGHE